MTLKELKEKHPEVYAALVAEAREAMLENANITDWDKFLEQATSLSDANESLTAELETAKASLEEATTKVTALEAKVSELEPDEETESDKKFRELQEKLAKSESREKRRDMTTYVLEKVRKGRYSKFAPLIVPNVVNENLVPESQEAADKAIEVCEKYIGAILKKGRSIGDLAAVTEGVGEPDHEALELEAANSMSEFFGDDEGASAFG